MDAEEFKKLIVPLSGKLMRFAQKFLYEKDIAEDTVQDVIVRLWRKRNLFEKLDSVEAYAMRITRNLCIDKSKEKRKILFRSAEAYANLPDQNQNADKQMEYFEAATVIKEIIQSLPEQQRMVIYLRDIEHYEFEEISDLLNMTNGAVRANLSRARKKVRDEMLRRS